MSKDLPYQYQVLREAAERHLDQELLEDELMLQNADHARRIADSAIARAKPTRFCMPPESSAGCRSAISVPKPTLDSTSMATCFASGLFT